MQVKSKAKVKYSIRLTQKINSQLKQFNLFYQINEDSLSIYSIKDETPKTMKHISYITSS